MTVDQVVYDAGQTKLAVRAAGLNKDMTAEDARRNDMFVIANVVRAYHTVTLAGENLKVAEEAVPFGRSGFEPGPRR